MFKLGVLWHFERRARSDEEGEQELKLIDGVDESSEDETILLPPLLSWKGCKACLMGHYELPWSAFGERLALLVSTSC